MTLSKPHTPCEMKVSGFCLWSDASLHPHVRMAEIIRHSPMNGIDSAHIANEMAKRWNSHRALIAALEDLLGDRPDIQGGICQHCGRDYIGEALEGACPSDDCPAHKARAVIATVQDRP
jgi:hypothetical protein